MTTLNHAKQPFTPQRSLSKQISWLPEKIETFPKSLNSTLTIGLIASDRMYWSMQYEGKVLAITEANWRWVLKHGEIDLLLIESCAETSTGDWFMAQTAPDITDTVFGSMVAAARSACIPVAYWFTLDEAYYPQYQQTISWMENVFCADPEVIENLSNQGKVAAYLPPAVQPALFTKLNEYSPNKKELKRVVCDDLVDVIQSWDSKGGFYKEVQDFGGYFFDSRNQVWNTKTKNLELKTERVLGTIDVKSRSALFKESRTLGILKSDSRTLTDMKWSVLEAAASHMTILLEPDLDLDDFSSMCLQPENRDQFFVELIRHDKDNLYYERVAQKAWRHALMNHTFSHRLGSICAELGLNHDWEEYPSAAMITPSYRKKFLSRATESFSQQTYPNKHWVMVFNGDKDEFSEVKSEVEKVDNAQAIYVPSELHAGPCMNAGIQQAPTEYVFRMDDDDYYGENYLLDMILYKRVVDFDVIGKVFRSFVVSPRGKEVTFYRKAKQINFRKPSFVTSANLPEGVSFLAGCSQGGNRHFILNNPYPDKNFGSVDSQWLNHLKEQVPTSKIVCIDDLNIVVDRRISGDHTWSANMDAFIKNSMSIYQTFQSVAFV